MAAEDRAEPLANPARTHGGRAMGLRRSWWMSFFGLPHGLPGRLGVRLMPRSSRQFHKAIATELNLQPEDELLDVGCGSATLFVDHAGHVRFVAGLDASEMQLEMARKRLAERIAAGTAEIVEGDADHLPWGDGRFSVITSVNAVKFFPDPSAALREMHRVLRPGGRVAVTMGEAAEAPAGATEGVVDTWGQWQWTDAAAKRLLEGVGFDDVSVSVMPVFSKALLARGVKPATAAVEGTPQAASTVAASVA
jgi:ubiquinone/menaquinone biosynthesis C-methylase UbiE